MAARGWRYIATRLNGDGTETPISFDVPIIGLQSTKTVSGAGQIRGKLEPEHRGLKGADGLPLFTPYSTAIYTEADGHLRNGAVLTDTVPTGHSLDLQTRGFMGMADGEPYEQIRSKVDVDPLHEFRHIWDYVQGQPGKNYGLVFDTTSSGVRIGSRKYVVTTSEDTTELWSASTMGNKQGNSFYVDESGTRVFISHAEAQRMLDANDTAEPYKLNYWSTHDLGRAAAELAKVGRFDYRTEFSWNGEDIRKFVRLGHPRLGRRLDDRFVVGENIRHTPRISNLGADYATKVVVLGAGEGRKMCRGSATRQTGRLGKTVVIVDDSLNTSEQCDRKAAEELRYRMGDASISQFTLPAHLAAMDEGDELLFQNTGGWAGDLEIWVRVLSITDVPEAGEAVLNVARVERVS